MIDSDVLIHIDRTIKDIWVKQIRYDYSNDNLLNEGSVKCSFYYHLRNKLGRILKANNLHIYPEFYFPNLKYRTDLAIVQLDYGMQEEFLKDLALASDVIAIIEIKLTSGDDPATTDWIMRDIQKMKRYLQDGRLDCLYYFACIYETEWSSLQWMDKRSTNNWAKGHVAELNAGLIDGVMRFEINSYNGLNTDL